MTVDEFWQDYAGKPHELVRGEVIPVVPAGLSHGRVTSRIAAVLWKFVDANGLGEVVGAETGFWLGPHTMCAADCAYISAEKMQSVQEPDKYAPFAPDLAVEVVSPTDNAADIRDKVDLYRAAGTRLVWVIYPSLRKVDVYLLDGTSHQAGADDVLNGGDVLPGLQIAVTDLFPAS